MLSLLLADAGPPPGLFFGFLACTGIAVALLITGVVLLGLWLAKRQRAKDNPPDAPVDRDR